MTDNLARRIDRLESHAAIQQLPIRYALAIDGRDVAQWAGLFVPDVNCGQHGAGRDVLKELITTALRSFYRSVHQICGHRIEFDDDDHAHGVVYCRAEHEDGDRWIVMAIAYFDTYERRGRDWYFVRRRERHWYAADWEERPAAPFTAWPAHPQEPTLPQDFATWAPFWDLAEPAPGLTRQPAARK